MLRLRIFFTILCLCFVSAASHAESNRDRAFSGLRACEHAILDFNQKRIGRILLPTERDFIRRLTDVSEASERKQRLRIAYRYFLERQIRGFPSELQQKLRRMRVVRKASVFPTAFFSFSIEQILLELPKQLWGSALDYTFLVHEMEHAVHALSFAEDYRTGRISFWRSEQSTHYVFLQEDATMSAEWEWLNALSPAARADCAEMLARGGFTPWHYNMHLAAGNRKDYLRSQRRQNRYSISNIKTQQRETRPRELHNFFKKFLEGQPERD